jgi:hypothetical protein
MNKQEFMDKIDKVRDILSDLPVEPISYEAIITLKQLKDDANLLLEDEWQAGHDAGWDEGREYARENE